MLTEQQIKEVYKATGAKGGKARWKNVSKKKRKEIMTELAVSSAEKRKAKKLSTIKKEKHLHDTK